jgi:hypothetical protein
MKKFLTFVLLITFSTVTYFAQGEQSGSWRTVFEKSGFVLTETYNQTIAYFKKLDSASAFAKLVEFGESPQGRKLYCLIVNKNGFFTPLQVRHTSSPVIMIQNGIHSGEIAGKDASMILLREILIEKKKINLIDNVTLLVIPIFNVDGHERRSPFNRINQNGPKEMGWRTTAQNFNLNRDYTKADTPEMRAWLKLYSRWLPDFFIDTHTTDGADYQYTITYGIDKHLTLFPKERKWIRKVFSPFIENFVRKRGFLISPYVGYVKGDFRNGIRDWIGSPRFSNCYATVQNRPGLLIETHMLKPFKDRVYSTKVLLEAVITLVNSHPRELLKMNAEADSFAIDRYFKKRKAYPVKFQLTDKCDSFLYRGKKPLMVYSSLVDAKIRKYSSENLNVKIPYYDYSKVADSVFLPSAYIIPYEYKNIATLMRLHGIKLYQAGRRLKAEMEVYKFKNVSFPSHPYEGRFSPSYNYDVLKDTVQISAKDFIVPTNQRTIGLIAWLLEPKFVDSFVKWGLFNPIFERKEYFEIYSMEPIAQRMFDSDSLLRKEYLRKVAEDSTFRKSVRARLNFFYEKSPYYDNHFNVYPVKRVLKWFSN